MKTHFIKREVCCTNLVLVLTHTKKIKLNPENEKLQHTHLLRFLLKRHRQTTTWLISFHLPLLLSPSRLIWILSQFYFTDYVLQLNFNLFLILGEQLPDRAWKTSGGSAQTWHSTDKEKERRDNICLKNTSSPIIQECPNRNMYQKHNTQKTL